MNEVRLLVEMQLLMTVFLVIMLWLFFVRLHQQEFFRLWAWGWTSFGLYLGMGSYALRLAPQWALFKQVTVLATIEAGFLQVPLLVLGSWSLLRGEGRAPRRLRWGIGLGLGAGALSLALSSLHADQPLTAFCWRTAPRTLSLALGLTFCAWVFVRKRGAYGLWTAAGPAAFCALYASDQFLYSVASLRYLILGPRTPTGGLFGLSLLLRPLWLFLDSTYTFGIGIGLVMLLLAEHERVQHALIENDIRARQIAEDNAALREEIRRRELAERELRNMSVRLMHAEEKERARIGHDLHEGLGTQLLLFTLAAGGLRRKCKGALRPVVKQVEKVEAIAKEIAGSVRFLSCYLHSPSLELLGLGAALSDFISEFERKNGMCIEFIQGELPKDLPRSTALCVYRVAQEALQNVLEHSGSSKARVELGVASGYIQLRVSDAGQGFASELAANTRSIGLGGMAERARNLRGDFSVQSSPGQGTSVIVWVPIGELSDVNPGTMRPDA